MMAKLSKTGKSKKKKSHGQWESVNTSMFVPKSHEGARTTMPSVEPEYKFIKADKSHLLLRSQIPATRTNTKLLMWRAHWSRKPAVDDAGFSFIILGQCFFFLSRIKVYSEYGFAPLTRNAFASDTFYVFNKSIVCVVVWVRNVLHRLMYLDIWCLVGVAVWGGYGTFRTWNLAGGMLLRNWLWGLLASLHFLVALFLSCVWLKYDLGFLLLLPCFPCSYRHLALWNHKPK